MNNLAGPRIAILAALPREILPLVRNWPVRNHSRAEGVFVAECDRAIAVCAGMGAERVTHALEIAETIGPLRSVISVGYAGAMRPGISARAIFWPSLVIDSRTNERHVCEQGSGTLVTTDHVVNRDEKADMAARWGADLVDMETATVARLAQQRGLPFRALRVVSDEAEELLPDLERFTDVHGGFREAAFARYILLRPWLIPMALHIGRNATQSSNILAKELREYLEQTQ